MSEHELDIVAVQEPARPRGSVSMNEQAPQASTPQTRYSVFTLQEKWFIVTMAGCAGLLSPLAAAIFWPAIPTLSKAFGKSPQDINLTFTVYMVFQGISPTLWGAIADSKGRRPVYLVCLSIFTLACVGLALTPTNAYWLLMVLRCISASGSAVLIALSAGTVGDLAEPSERGKYMGFVSMGPQFGPCIGPVFGGLLNSVYGWRAVFWFLAILAFCVFLPMLFWFPETLRSIVGNGSIRAHGTNVTLWRLLHFKGNDKEENSRVYHNAETTTLARKSINPLVGLRYFLEKDVAIILFFNALNFNTFYAVTTSLSTLLEERYNLSTSETGLCYLPIGFGSFVSTLVTGRLLDRDFRLIKSCISSEDGSRATVPTGDTVAPYDHNNLAAFPIERARLRSMPIYCLMFWGSVVAYGWMLRYRISLVAILIFQFIIGYSIMGIMQISQVILVDLFPGNSATATANNNLCRCLVGAVGTAIVDPIINALQPGWTLVIFTAACILFSPLMLLEWERGMVWRISRLKNAPAGHLAHVSQIPAQDEHLGSRRMTAKEV